MQRVLILTKNVLSEESLIQQLHRLNTEVLCSSDLLENLQQGKNLYLFNYFQVAIISETISNLELDQILPVLKRTSLGIIRSSTVEIAEGHEEHTQWIHERMYKKDSLEEVREALVRALLAVNKYPKLPICGKQSLINPAVDESYRNQLQIIHKRLSKNEKRLFEQLMMAKYQGEASTRKSLCEQLWNTTTPSAMSQLSSLVHKIKRKFEEMGIHDEVISTKWGQGYEISDDFHQKWLLEEQSADSTSYQIV